MFTGDLRMLTKANLAGHGPASDRTIKAPTKIFKRSPGIKARQRARTQTEHKSSYANFIVKVQRDLHRPDIKAKNIVPINIDWHNANYSMNISFNFDKA